MADGEESLGEACEEMEERALGKEDIVQGLSTLGLTADGRHAYVRLDLPQQGLASLEVLRGYGHLQFLNLARNKLRSLEPLGALRSLLHLNVSHNLLEETQTFPAPEGLETVDMSYNLVRDMGDWSVHRYLRELSLRGNALDHIGPGLLQNQELRMLDLSENHISKIQNLHGLGLQVLHLAQNRLTSLEGLSNLQQLQVLTVRNNVVPSLEALSVDHLPRLLRLCVAENRLHSMKEFERLQSFPLLADLLVEPNPVTALPHFRAQVLHRLPRLRSLDGQPASAEEKVKAEVIYGADVEARREVFQELLPQESFVDRRLVTKEGIAKEEKATFGREGDVGSFGG